MKVPILVLALCFVGSSVCSAGSLKVNPLDPDASQMVMFKDAEGNPAVRKFDPKNDPPEATIAAQQKLADKLEEVQEKLMEVTEKQQEAKEKLDEAKAAGDTAAIEEAQTAVEEAQEEVLEVQEEVQEVQQEVEEAQAVIEGAGLEIVVTPTTDASVVSSTELTAEKELTARDLDAAVNPSPNS